MYQGINVENHTSKSNSTLGTFSDQFCRFISEKLGLEAGSRDILAVSGLSELDT